MKVFVIGSGVMGSGIAEAFAQSGVEVILYDLTEELVQKGNANISGRLAKLVQKGKITEEKRAEITKLISTTTDKSEAAGCELVVEAILENIEIKKKLFNELDSICSIDTILATNTSSLSITEIAAATKNPDRVIGMHFFNPAPVMKLVEIIRGIATSDKTFAKVREICGQIGKEGIEVKEGPGFVVNRILIPMINEAAAILSEGIASAEDIDKAMVNGANHPMGPLALGDLVGNDVCLAIMQTLYTETGDAKYRPHPLLKKMVRAGYLGRKTGKGFFEYK